jgi:predicted nucleic acid-binding protein
VKVVDASVLIPALGGAEDGGAARELLAGELLAAPEVIDLEVASAFRRAVRSGAVDGEEARRALFDLSRLPLARASHTPLLSRIWELRDNLSAYDAAYVALAELIAAPLVTSDGAFMRAPGIRCEIDLVA